MADVSSGASQVQGEAAHDAPVVGNPLLIGLRYDTTLPVDVSTDGDLVTAWGTAKGALVVSLATSIGTFIDGDNTNGLDVDVTRLPLSVVSTNNSTTSVLGVGGVFTGGSDNVENYAMIVINVFASHDSAAQGLSIQQSSNGTNWDKVDTFTYAASTAGQAYSFQPAGRFFRIVYTNGGTLQTNFRMQTVFHWTVTKSSSVKPTDSTPNETDTEQVSSFLFGYNTTTWDRLHSFGIGADALSASSHGVGVLMTTAFGMMYNGATWDRVRGDTTNGLDVDVTRVTGGGVAHDAGDSGNPIKIGSRAISALGTRMTANDRSDVFSDLWGRVLTAQIDPLMQISKSFNATTTQTGTDVWDPAASARIAVTSLIIGAYGTTAARLILWFGDNADTTYTAGTDQVLFAASFAPSATSKPGAVINFDPPIFCTTADRELHVTTDAGMSVDITVHGYEW